MSLNITTHAKKRYVQRYLRIIPTREWTAYLEAHDAEVTQALHDWADAAEVFWRGELGDKLSTYRLYHDWVLVLDYEETALVTLYPVEFGFPLDTNLTVLKSLRKELAKVQKAVEQRTAKYVMKADKLEHDRDALDAELAALKDRQVILERERGAVVNLLQAMEDDAGNLRREEALLVSKVVGTMAYREDLAELAKKK